MIPIFLVGSSVLQIGPFRLGLQGDPLSAVPWPDRAREVLPPAWKPAGFSPYGDGGIWVVRPAKRDDFIKDLGSGTPEKTHSPGETPEALAILLNRNGDPVRTLEIPPVNWLKLPSQQHREEPPGLFPVSVFQRYALIGNVVLTPEKTTILKPRDELVRENIDPRMLRMGPDGLMLSPSGMAIDPDGETKEIFNTATIVGQVMKSLQQTGIKMIQPRISVLGWDRETAWFLVTEQDAWISPVVVLRVLHSENNPLEVSVARHAVASISTWVDLLNPSAPLPDGGWALSVFKTRADDSEPPEHEIWFRLPGNMNVFSISMSRITGSGYGDIWQISYLPGVGLVLLVSIFRKGHEPRSLVVLSDGTATRILEAFTGNVGWDILSKGWMVIPDGNAIFLPTSYQLEASLPEGVLWRHQLVSIALPPGGEREWEFKKLLFAGPVIVVVFDHWLRNRAFVNLFWVKDGKANLILQNVFEGEFVDVRMTERNRWMLVLKRSDGGENLAEVSVQ